MQVASSVRCAPKSWTKHHSSPKEGEEEGVGERGRHIIRPGRAQATLKLGTIKEYPSRVSFALSATSSLVDKIVFS